MARKLAVFATFGKVLKLTFLELYNALGYAILVSSIWCVAAFPVILIIFADMTFTVKSAANPQTGVAVIPTLILSFLIISLWNGLVLGPVMSMLFAAHQQRKEDYLTFKTFIDSFKKFYWVSARIYWVFSFGVTLVMANFFVSLSQPGLFFKICGILSVYILFFAFNMPLYFQPLMYYKHSFINVLKKAFLLVMDNMALSFLLSLLTVIMIVICAPTVILMVLIFGAFYLFMTDNAFEFISEKYEAE